MTAKIDLQETLKEAKEFPLNFKTLQLATSSFENVPEASYAPYVFVNGDYYIYTSELSKHNKNLSSNNKCSILFIEDEDSAQNIFARKRLTLECSSVEILRNNNDFEDILNYFHIKFGNFISMLRKLEDFHLFKLSPNSGSYVAGFAKAFVLSGEGLNEISHRNEKGHKTPDKNTELEMTNSL